MKKVLSTMLALMLLAFPMLGLADAIQLETLGVTLEMPEGWTAVEQTVEESKMTIVVLSNTSNPVLGGSIIRMENDMFAFIDLNTADDATLKGMMSGFAQGAPDDYAITIETAEDGSKFMLIKDTAGKTQMVGTIEGSTLLMIGLVSQTEALTEDDLAVLDAMVAAFSAAEAQ